MPIPILTRRIWRRAGCILLYHMVISDLVSAGAQAARASRKTRTTRRRRRARRALPYRAHSRYQSVLGSTIISETWLGQAITTDSWRLDAMIRERASDPAGCEPFWPCAGAAGQRVAPAADGSADVSCSTP